MRRLRRTGLLRGLVRETELSPAHLVYPMFVRHGLDGRAPITSMPGIDHLSVSAAVDEAGEAAALGIPAVLLFGLPAAKDEAGSGAWDDEGIVQTATRAIKAQHPDLLVITDLCLCEYTSHGHCGVLREDGEVDNDLTLELLARTAVSQAEAGADVVAPSDMMDGRVGALRAALDDHGLTPVVESQADLIRRVKDATNLPVAAYNVSGEYAMLKAAVAAGLLDERPAVLEALTGIRRAGADIVITYHAKDVSRWLS